MLKPKSKLQLAIVFIFFNLSVFGCAITPRTTNTPGVSNTLRVMVWNVLHGANDVTNGAEKA